jgi:hypothetical protein
LVELMVVLEPTAVEPSAVMVEFTPMAVSLVLAEAPEPTARLPVPLVVAEPASESETMRVLLSMAAWSWPTFTASVSATPAARFTMRLSLPAEPTLMVVSIIFRFYI